MGEFGVSADKQRHDFLVFRERADDPSDCYECLIAHLDELEVGSNSAVGWWHDK